MRAQRTAATRYEWQGELLTKSEMLKRAVAKEVVFMGKDKPVYHAIMDLRDQDASVFRITQADFDRLRAKDVTTPRAREQALEYEYQQLMAKKLKQMRDSVDFNMWVKQNKPTLEERVEYLRNFRASAGGTAHRRETMNRRMVAREMTRIARLLEGAWPSKVKSGGLREAMGLDPSIPLEEQSSPSAVAKFFEGADASGRGMVMFAVNSNQDVAFWKKVASMIGK